MTKPACVLILAAWTSLSAQETSPKASFDNYKLGHSRHGEVFDEGPRAKPWEMAGIGNTPFPITHKNPEVQKWFNQGTALLHSFWDYEAERAFRWCLKLEPENAMAYWGMARATSGDRSKEFIRQAVKRKNTVTERERLYIEALEARELTDSLRDRGADYRERSNRYKQTLETLCVKYPDDLEARALLAYANMGDSRYGTELLVREILARNPDHPGAHHYRIHNWNHHEPEQALDSARRFGEIAPGIGHALHMPGHIFSTVGMWNEAAIAMDSATRVEKQYMVDRLTFPFNNWNYGHNRSYLSYIQEQLGMAEASIFGARQLIDAPLDPKQNADLPYSSHSQGIENMMRVLIKFERWDALLDKRTIPWREIFLDRMRKAYSETRAHLGLGNRDQAMKALDAFAALKKDLEKNKGQESTYSLMDKELRARLALLRGETLSGLALLTEAAEQEYERQKSDNDPPHYPQFLYPELGRAYLAAKSPALAAQAFEKSLKLVRNDCFALSGMVEAYHAMGEKSKAEEAMARLLYVTADADKGLKLVERSVATGIRAKPRDTSPGTQRNYRRFSLDRFGPNTWEPFASPPLEVHDPDGKPVTLSEYRGKNVILVFYLGRECLHCMNQLKDLQRKREEWERLETVVLAVSGNRPDDNKANLKSINLGAIRLLSDEGFANSRRFRSYDDFEEMEIHSTILIDKRGRVHWARSGGEPFGDMAFLEKQLRRMNQSVETAPAAGGSE